MPPPSPRERPSPAESGLATEEQKVRPGARGTWVPSGWLPSKNRHRVTNESGTAIIYHRLSCLWAWEAFFMSKMQAFLSIFHSAACTRYARTLAEREVFFLPRKESAEAPPAADEARRFRGSAPVGGREQRTGTGWRNGDGRKKRMELFSQRERCELCETNKQIFFSNRRRKLYVSVQFCHP